MSIYLRNFTSVLRGSTRSLATIAPSSSQISSALPSASVPSTESIAEHEGPLRPHLKIPVNPKHGLYGFFRAKTDTNSHSKPKIDGQPEYVTVEPMALLSTGRSWHVSEIRRKSFKDLHTLWYILLRERNLLATQSVEKKKYKAPLSGPEALMSRDCRKSMARIKVVISERRNAYIQAARMRRELRRSTQVSQATLAPPTSRPTPASQGSGEIMLEGAAESIIYGVL